MFTGLVEAVGVVESITPAQDQARITIRIPFASELALGDSVAINGCCLTVADLGDGTASFDLLTQTLNVTSLGSIAEGSDVNLERAMQVGDRFGGHFVQGHVDSTGTILGLEGKGQDHILRVSLPAEIHRLCVPKGSISIDGISLTIAELEVNQATFWITPHTWDHTNLRSSAVGSTVNLEADMLAKHVDHLLSLRNA